MPSALRIKELRDLNDNVIMSDGALTGNVTFPAGHIIQVQQFVKTDAASTNNNQHSTWVHLGMIKEITTTSASSDVLIHFSCTMSSLTGAHNFSTKITKAHTGFSEGDIGVSTTGYSNAYHATTAGTRTSDNNTYMIHTMMFMDSPNFQGPITYKLYHLMQNASPGIGYLNRTQLGTGDDRHTGGISTITLFEIAR